MTDPMTRPGDVEAAARKMRTARERKAMAGPDLSAAIVAEQRLYQALDDLDAAHAAHSPVQPIVGELDVERLKAAARTLWPAYDSAASSEDHTSSVDHSMERLAAEYRRLSTDESASMEVGENG